MFRSRLATGESRAIAAGTTLAAVPSLGLLLGHQHGLAQLVPTVALLSYALVLGAAVLTYFHWRLQHEGVEDALRRRLSGWLAVGLTVGAVSGLLQLTGSWGDGLWPAGVQLAVTVFLCGCAALCERVDVPVEPAVACAVAAVAITAAFSLGAAFGPTVTLSPTASALLSTSIVVAALVLALVILNRTKVSLWVRRRLAAATVLMTFAQAVDSLDRPYDAVLAAAGICLAGGALVLVLMTHRLLRSALLQQQAEVALLQRSLAEVRAAVRVDRELLHEVGATLAGITTASRVMRHHDAVPAHRRQRIETMVAAELARLERLMQQRVDGCSADEDRRTWLDDVVEPIVISHQERGRLVSWSPSGQQAWGDPDQLAEICNILLENAARHAPGAAVQLSVTAHDDEIVVICADNGPGVPAALRSHIFDAEAKRDGSPGQGLGLAIAHRLATARGGSMELVDHGRPGATFAARLPRQEVRDVAAAHVA
jgi:signal transduction histidine kinase